jgi:type 1 glutamine amidotransferase
LEKRGLNCTVLVSDDVKSIPGVEALDDADLLILFARRRELPPEQAEHFRRYFDSGKPVVGLRTASHAFQNDSGFDKRVLGGNYHNHYGNDGTTKVTATAGGEKHPILTGVAGTFEGKGSLYKNAPLPEGSLPLLAGRWTDKPEEPVAWTHSYMGGRVFYTSLGAPGDFETPAFRRLLLNGVFWALDKPIPAD